MIAVTKEFKAPAVGQVMHDGQMIAPIIWRQFHKEGIEFFPPGTFPQQIDPMSRPRSHVNAPHVHRPVAREVQHTNSPPLRTRVVVNFALQKYWPDPDHKSRQQTTAEGQPLQLMGTGRWPHIRGTRPAELSPALWHAHVA